MGVRCVLYRLLIMFVCLYIIRITLYEIIVCTLFCFVVWISYGMFILYKTYRTECMCIREL